MRARGVAAVLGMAAVLQSCGDDGSNPFASVARTRPPSPTAALVFVSSSPAGEPGKPREVLAIDAEGGNVERLTNCGSVPKPCDYVQVAPAPDRVRMAAIRTEPGAEAGATALYFVDLSRSVEALLQARRRVFSVDWSGDSSFLLYTANDTTGNEEIFYSNPNGTAEQNLSETADVRERQPRADPASRTAAFERIDSSGVSRIYLYQATPLTSGPATGPGLPGTPYVVGGDADPAWSPDSLSVVFRRLTGTGNGGLGTWDLMVVGSNGSNLRTLVSGALYRGAPDWGRAGIVFVETDAASGQSQLVLVQPDGSGRRVLRTEPVEFGMAAPRFLFGE